MLRRKTKRARDRTGFTLVEMLLVVVIIGILSGTVAISLSGRSQEARVTRARADIESLSQALQLFEHDTGRYPTSNEGLQALMEDPGVAGWKGSYLIGGLKPDPWGTPYAYSRDPEGPEHYSIRSAGPDGQLGSEDDISL